MSLLSDVAEKTRCIDHRFSSSFYSVREVFVVISALCEPSNPFRICYESRKKVLVDSRRRKRILLYNGKDLHSDSITETSDLNEIQKLITRNGYKSRFGATRSPNILSDLCSLAFNERSKLKYYDECSSIELKTYA